MPRRRSTILSMYSMARGHSSSQAPQVVQDQISSSVKMPPTSAGLGCGVPHTGKVLNSRSRALMVMKRGDNGRSQRGRRALIGTAAAVGTTVEIEQMLPGEILDLLDADRLQITDLLIAQPVLHRLDHALVQPHEEDVEEGGQDMEMLAKGQVAEEEKKDQIMNIIGGDV